MSTPNTPYTRERDFLSKVGQTHRKAPVKTEPGKRLLFERAKDVTKKDKKAERIALGATLMFTLAVAFIGWYTDGAVFTSALDKIWEFEAPGHASRDPGINCQLPANIHTPYCERRRADIKATWDGITRNDGGRQTVFSLTTPKRRYSQEKRYHR